MFDQFLGLPLHPLIVHAVVVLLPLGALGLLVLTVWKKGRRVGLPLSVAVLAAGTVSAWAARFSGQALRQRVGVADLHANLGGVLPLVATLLLVVAVVWWRLARTDKDPLGVRIVVALTALVAVVMTAVVGHSGAQSVWGAVGESSSPAQSVAPTTSASQPEQTTSSTDEPSASASVSVDQAPETPGYTATEVAEHATAEDCWVIIDETVYDLTAWVNQHPGGADRITALCGTDGTAAFTGQHSGDSAPQQRLTEFELGPLSTE